MRFLVRSQGAAPNLLGREMDWYDTKKIQEAVLASKTYAGVLRKLDLCPTGNNQATLKKYIQKYGIPTDHFKPASERCVKQKVCFDEISRRPIATASLRRCVLRENLIEYKCAICGLSDWHDSPLSLNLDHIDGDRTHNTLDNLRWLCPNCDSQQTTFRARNKRKDKNKHL